MAEIKPNDNQDLEDEETTEGEEEDTSTDGEEGAEGAEDTGADDEDDGEGEDSDEDEGADDEGDKGADDDGDFVIPEKFKGKKVEDVAKSYVELEKNIQKKAAEIARDMIAKGRGTKKVTKEDDAAIKDAMKGVDFSKMKPEEFASWLIKTVESRAQEIARNTYDAADSTKTQVQNEINVVTKTWPQLKENTGFRDLVLSLIENAANKGNILTLKEACAKVGKHMGIKPGAKKAMEGQDGGKGEGEGEEGKDGKKRPKTGVERASGAGGGKNETEEDKVIAGLMGGKGPNSMGGLF